MLVSTIEHTLHLKEPLNDWAQSQICRQRVPIIQILDMALNIKFSAVDVTKALWCLIGSNPIVIIVTPSIRPINALVADEANHSPPQIYCKGLGELSASSELGLAHRSG